jgi:uncharacterized protein YndB with AHSA1/START domain
MPAGEVTRRISLSIWIATDTPRVFQALTSANELTKWLVPKAERVSSDGAKLKFIWPHNSFEVTFLAREPDRKVVMSWYHQNGIGPEISFTLTPVNNGTLVSFEHGGFSSSPEYLEAYVNHVEGWTMYLCNLKCWLDYGKDLRAGQPQGTIAM